jgi:hypothetical protein
MYRSSSWTGVAFGRRTMWSATVVGVAAKAFHFEVAKPGVNCIAQRRRRLRRTLKAEHALVPRLRASAARLRLRAPMRRKSSRVI